MFLEFGSFVCYLNIDHLCIVKNISDQCSNILVRHVRKDIVNENPISKKRITGGLSRCSNILLIISGNITADA